ncbi:IclR family transcriptional regulator [Pseudomonas capsici]|uniref:IclR family transcriptional regulator n=1 Tax=Pseudomonas capsici TaxID=2810614 RepID=UPI0021F0B872|nr:IclR family transcriptional regulator [Pseudomonas capsici]MCV4343726.1 IclR family transcriptional regulator [Pseudomonas capsici]
MKTVAPHNKDTDYIVPALARGLSVLGMFDARTRSLGINEIAERLEVSTSAVYRILFTLTHMGYLNKVNSQYELGTRVISDGFSYLASRDIVEVAMPHLNELRDRTSLSCHLSIREQTDSLYLYRAFAAQRLSVNIPVGTRIACHCTAMGRMLLTALSEAELGALYQHIRLDDYPPPAPRTLPELQGLIQSDRERGWVLHRSDYSTAIATSIKDHKGQVTAAINLSGPDAVMDPEGAKERFQVLLLECSATISRELGHKSDMNFS